MAEPSLTMPIETVRSDRTEYRLGLFFVTASAFAWCTGGLFTRLLSLDSWTMLLWRGLFAALGVFVVIFAMEGRQGLARVRTMDRYSWIFATVWAIGMIFFITSLRQTTVAHVAVIFTTAPFIAAAIAFLVMGERPGKSAVLASLAALAGVALMMGLASDGSLSGDLLAFGMTVCTAVTIVMAKRYPSIPPMHAAGLSALICGLMALPFAHPFGVTGHEFVILALFGLINSAAGLALFSLGARRLPAIETALIGSLDAPLAPLAVFLVFGETPSWSTIFGGLVVLAAVAAHILASVERGDVKASPPLS